MEWPKDSKNEISSEELKSIGSPFRKDSSVLQTFQHPETGSPTPLQPMQRALKRKISSKIWKPPPKSSGYISFLNSLRTYNEERKKQGICFFTPEGNDQDHNQHTNKMQSPGSKNEICSEELESIIGSPFSNYRSKLALRKFQRPETGTRIQQSRKETLKRNIKSNKGKPPPESSAYNSYLGKLCSYNEKAKKQGFCFFTPEGNDQGNNQQASKMQSPGSVGGHVQDRGRTIYRGQGNFRGPVHNVPPQKNVGGGLGRYQGPYSPATYEAIRMRTMQPPIQKSREQQFFGRPTNNVSSGEVNSNEQANCIPLSVIGGHSSMMNGENHNDKTDFFSLPHINGQQSMEGSENQSFKRPHNLGHVSRRDQSRRQAPYRGQGTFRGRGNNVYSQRSFGGGIDGYQGPNSPGDYEANKMRTMQPPIQENRGGEQLFSGRLSIKSSSEEVYSNDQEPKGSNFVHLSVESQVSTECQSLHNSEGIRGRGHGHNVYSQSAIDGFQGTHSQNANTVTGMQTMEPPIEANWRQNKKEFSDKQISDNNKLLSELAFLYDCGDSLDDLFLLLKLIEKSTRNDMIDWAKVASKSIYCNIHCRKLWDQLKSDLTPLTFGSALEYVKSRLLMAVPRGSDVLEMLDNGLDWPGSPNDMYKKYRRNNGHASRIGRAKVTPTMIAQLLVQHRNAVLEYDKQRFNYYKQHPENFVKRSVLTRIID